MRRELSRVEPLTAADVIAIPYGIFFTLFALLFLPFYSLVPVHDKDENPVDSTRSRARLLQETTPQSPSTAPYFRDLEK